MGDCNKTLVTATKVVAQVVTAKSTKTVLTAGFAGKDGIDGDLHLRHVQPSADTLWSILHNMDKYPSVTVVDSAGTQVEGTVTFISVNQLTIEFNSAFSGTAYLN